MEGIIVEDGRAKEGVELAGNVNRAEKKEQRKNSRENCVGSLEEGRERVVSKLVDRMP